MVNQNATKKYQEVHSHNSKVDQLIMLYEGIIKFLSKAKTAMKDKDIQARHNNIDRALDVINGLQLCLDYSADEKLAKNLYDFYTSIGKKLLLINLDQGTEEDLDSVIKSIIGVKKSWEDVAKEYKAMLEAKEQNSSSSDYPDLKSGLTINI